VDPSQHGLTLKRRDDPDRNAPSLVAWIAEPIFLSTAIKLEEAIGLIKQFTVMKVGVRRLRYIWPHSSVSSVRSPPSGSIDRNERPRPQQVCHQRAPRALVV
jgi:hypothetical protein